MFVDVFVLLLLFVLYLWFCWLVLAVLRGRFAFTLVACLAVCVTWWLACLLVVNLNLGFGNWWRLLLGLLVLWFVLYSFCGWIEIAVCDCLVADYVGCFIVFCWFLWFVVCVVFNCSSFVIMFVWVLCGLNIWYWYGVLIFCLDFFVVWLCWWMFAWRMKLCWQLGCCVYICLCCLCVCFSCGGFV